MRAARRVKAHAWLLALAVFGAWPVAASASETIGLCVNDATRDTLHSEMRQLLGALHGIHLALAERDFEALTARAEAVGSAMTGQVEGKGHAHQHAHPSGLPHDFVKLGRATHAAFDDLADLSREGGRPRELLPALAKVTAGCVGCHEQYRLVPAANCAAD